MIALLLVGSPTVPLVGDPTVLLAGDPTGEAAKSGPWGLAIILLLVVACFFLFRSMSRHLRKVRDHFPGDVTVKPGPEQPPSEPVDLHKESDAGGS